MGYKQSLHIHSVYCDGNDTLEQIVLTAIDKGYDSIGFSGHSNMEFASEYSMSESDTKEYKEVIAKLKEQYAKQIKIYCGLEVDMYSEVDLTGFDYLIGSVHCMYKDGEIVDFDRSADVVQKIVDTQFGGDGMAYAKLYYETLAKLPEHGKFDIIGHFDLITKHCENVCFFDQESREYKRYAAQAAEALAGKIPFFEVNTGAIARGYRTTPYPSPFLIQKMRELGFCAVITSDCHSRDMLDCGYDDAKKLLQSCGFKEHYVLTDCGFQPISLDD